MHHASSGSEVWQKPSRIPRMTVHEQTRHSPIFTSAVRLDEGHGNARPDKVRAAQLYQQAIHEESHVGAMVRLGLLLQDGGAGVQRDTQQALVLFKRASDQTGDVLAIYLMARLFHYGVNGIQKDVMKAMSLYIRAKEKGNCVRSMNGLGLLLLETHRELKSDPVTALRLFERAASLSQGNYESRLNLANLLHTGAPGVMRNCWRAAELYAHIDEKTGDPRAKYGMGKILEEGTRGYPKNPGRAAELYLQAIENGAHLGSRRRLANLFWKGAEGVTRNPPAAIKLMQGAIDVKREKLDILKLGKWLISEEAGEHRNPQRAFCLFSSLYDMTLTLAEDRELESLHQTCSALIQKSAHIKTGRQEGYDVFISHAGSEKTAVAEHIYQHLTACGLKCFLDEKNLEISTRPTRDQLIDAIHRSRAVIFILSREFISRKWPMLELIESLKIRHAAKTENKKVPLLVPLFYTLKVEECKNFTSMLARDETLLSLRRNGYFELDRMKEYSFPELHQALNELASLSGIRNDHQLDGPRYAKNAACRIEKAFFAHLAD